MAVPLALLILQEAFGGARGMFDGAGFVWMSVISSALFVLGIGLLPPVQPLVFGSAAAVAFPFLSVLLWGRSTNPGSLAALAIFFTVAFGVAVCVPAAGVAWWLRRNALPQWIPVVPIAGAIGLSLASGMAARQRSALDVTAIEQTLRGIHQAEIAGSWTSISGDCNFVVTPRTATRWFSIGPPENVALPDLVRSKVTVPPEASSGVLFIAMMPSTTSS